MSNSKERRIQNQNDRAKSKRELKTLESYETNY